MEHLSIVELRDERKVAAMDVTDIPWEDLVFSLREHELRVLELLYVPEPRPAPFRQLYAALKWLGYSQRTSRRKIAKLRELGLLTTVQSVIGIANPRLEIAENVRRLLQLAAKRREMATTFRLADYQEIVRQFEARAAAKADLVEVRHEG